MRLVIQRVKEASVRVVGRDKIVGEIGNGLLILIGVGEGDNKKDAEAMAQKLSKLRIMSDTEGKMNLSVKDIEGEILAVSQFTLYADTSGGNRPSFIKAAKPVKAREIYDYFVVKLKDLGVKVKTGEFGSYMKIKAELDGPVTILL